MIIWMNFSHLTEIHQESPADKFFNDLALEGLGMFNFIYLDKQSNVFFRFDLFFYKIGTNSSDNIEDANDSDNNDNNSETSCDTAPLGIFDIVLNRQII